MASDSVVAEISETVSCISWAPGKDLLIAGSWDSSVYLYDIPEQASRVNKELAAPILCAQFYPDGTKVFAGLGNNKAVFWDVTSDVVHPFAEHDAPIKALHFHDGLGFTATAGWDSKLKFWDNTSGSLVHSIDLTERAYAMDVSSNALVLADAGGQINVMDLRVPSRWLDVYDSPLKFQMRAVKIFPDEAGYLVSSIEGRVAVRYFQDETQNFAFKCHRKKPQVYSVNALSFHKPYGTFATAGSDGAFNTWDLEAKWRVKAFPSLGAPITAAEFNDDGTYFCYATGYDWSHGVDDSAPRGATLYCHEVADSEVKRKAK